MPNLSIRKFTILFLILNISVAYIILNSYAKPSQQSWEGLEEVEDEMWEQLPVDTTQEGEYLKPKKESQKSEIEEDNLDKEKEGVDTLEAIEKLYATTPQMPKILTNLEDCIKVALLNDKRIQVTLKDIRYQRFKIIEAQRNFWPQVKGQWENSEAEEDNNKDKRNISLRYSVETRQIIFNGGKLNYTLKQHKTDLAIAKKKFEQARQEVVYKVEEAYYKLVKNKMIYEINYSLSKSAESALSFVRKAYNQGLNSYHEFLNIQSQTDQTYYQLLSSQHDMSLSELELRQVCNLDKEIKIKIDAVLTFADFAFNYALDECLDLGFKHRPDLMVNRLTTISDLYGVKLAKAEGLPKVEFIGNLGKSGQESTGKKLELNEEWSLQLQATWIIGANSTNYTFDQKKTIPKKFGAKDNTSGSTANKFSIGIFDKLNNFSDLAKAEVEKATAEADLAELEGKVANEIEESYFSFQKAMTMATASLSKIKYYEKDLEINSAKQKMDEIPL